MFVIYCMHPVKSSGIESVIYLISILYDGEQGTLFSSRFDVAFAMQDANYVSAFR